MNEAIRTDKPCIHATETDSSVRGLEDGEVLNERGNSCHRGGGSGGYTAVFTKKGGWT